MFHKMWHLIWADLCTSKQTYYLGRLSTFSKFKSIPWIEELSWKNIIDHFKAGGLLRWSRHIRSFQICPSNWKDKVSKNRDDYNQTMNELSLGVTEQVVTIAWPHLVFFFLFLPLWYDIVFENLNNWGLWRYSWKWNVLPFWTIFIIFFFSVDKYFKRLLIKFSFTKQ